MGGSFTVDSAPGEGTTAPLVLPLTRTAEDSRVNLGCSRAKPARAAVGAYDSVVATQKE